MILNITTISFHFFRCRIAWLVIGSMAAMGLTSCRTAQPTTRLQIFTAEHYCLITPPDGKYYDSLWAQISEEDSVFSPGVMKRFTQRTRSVASDIGILPLLTDFVETEGQLSRHYTESGQVTMNNIRQQIAEHISLASFELNSVAAELDCEQDRAVALKNYLQLQADKRVRRMTIYSILAGAFATAFVSTLTLSNVRQPVIESVSVGGALVSGYYAFRSLGSDDQTLFNHPRNHLKDIRDNPVQSKVFPPIVWHFLTREYEVRSQTPTVREIILTRWRELNLLTEVDTEVERKRVELLFGEGGLYNLDEINYRISLIDLLDTRISIMNEELKQLRIELLVEKNGKR